MASLSKRVCKVKQHLLLVSKFEIIKNKWHKLLGGSLQKFLWMHIWPTNVLMFCSSHDCFSGTQGLLLYLGTGRTEGLFKTNEQQQQKILNASGSFLAFSLSSVRKVLWGWVERLQPKWKGTHPDYHTHSHSISTQTISAQRSQAHTAWTPIIPVDWSWWYNPTEEMLQVPPYDLWNKVQSPQESINIDLS